MPLDSARAPRQPLGGRSWKKEPLNLPQTLLFSAKSQSGISLKCKSWGVFSGDQGLGVRAQEPGWWEGWGELPSSCPPFPPPDPSGGLVLSSLGLAFDLWVPTLWSWWDQDGKGGAVDLRHPLLFQTANCPSTDTSLFPDFLSLRCSPRPSPGKRDPRILRGPRGTHCCRGSRQPLQAGWRQRHTQPLETAWPPPHRSHTPLPLGVLRCWQMAELNLLRRRSKKGKLN